MLELIIGGKRWVFGEVKCSKVKYGHQATAEKAAVAMNKKTGDDYDAYHCGTCNAWHIGHAR